MEVERALGTLDATHKVPRNPGLPREEHRGFPAPPPLSPSSPPPVFGVDATAAAQEAIAAKSMTGTIKQDAVGMANAVVKIAENLGLGKGTFDDVVGDLEGTWRVNIPYSAYQG